LGLLQGEGANMSKKTSGGVGEPGFSAATVNVSWNRSPQRRLWLWRKHDEYAEELSGCELLSLSE